MSTPIPQLVEIDEYNYTACDGAYTIALTYADDREAAAAAALAAQRESLRRAASHAAAVRQTDYARVLVAVDDMRRLIAGVATDATSDLSVAAAERFVRHARAAEAATAAVLGAARRDGIADEDLFEVTRGMARLAT